MRKLSDLEYRQKLFEVWGDRYEALSEYKDSNSKIRFKCNKCQYEWSAIGKSLLRGHGCPECGRAIARVTIKHNVTQEQFIQKVKKIDPTLVVLSDYRNAISRVDIECTVCGRRWSPKALDLIAGRGCIRCKRDKKGLKSRKDPATYAKQIEKEYTGSILLLEGYVAGETLIQFQCTNCNFIGKKEAGRLLKRGCPNCSESKGETKIAYLLDLLDIKYRRQYWFKDLKGDKNPLRFDFVFVKDDVVTGCLEYDGSQHFKPFFMDKDKSRFELQKRYDKLKDEYCQQKGLPLIRIPYYDYPKLEISYLEAVCQKLNR